MNKCMVYIYIHTYTNLYHYIEDFCSFMQAWCSVYRHPFYNRSIDFIKLVDFPDCVGRFWKIFLQRKDLELVIRSPASRFCDGGPWPRVWSSVRLTCLALSCVLLSGASGRAMHRGMQLQFVFRSNHTTIAPATQPEADQSLRQEMFADLWFWGYVLVPPAGCFSATSRWYDDQVRQVLKCVSFTDAECHPRSVWIRSCTMNSNGHCVPTGSPSHLELWETTCLWAPYSNSLLVALVDLMNLDDLMTLTLWGSDTQRWAALGDGRQHRLCACHGIH